MVVKRFLRSKFNSAVHSIPEGRRAYAIGDIHGRLDLLDQILTAIDLDDAQRPEADKTLIFLGDLVDRGPDSRGVIERLLALRESGVDARFLLGNHDELFLKAASGDVKATRFLTRVGGKDTILSYGVDAIAYQDASYAELAQIFSREVPAAHKGFLASFENYIELGDYLFVHAGVRPGVELAQQAAVDLRWIRAEFLNHRDSHGKMVVHGHSISDEADIRHNRIGIDTGAFATGRLTALGLEGSERWYLSATGEPDTRWGKLTD